MTHIYSCAATLLLFCELCLFNFNNLIFILSQVLRLTTFQTTWLYWCKETEWTGSSWTERMIGLVLVGQRD